MVLFGFYAYALIWPLVLVQSQTFLELQDYGMFPHRIEEEFSFYFVQRFPDAKLEIFHSMLFLIRDINQKKVAKAVILYGFLEHLDNEIRNNYFGIPKWEKKLDPVRFSVSMYFTNNSNGMVLEVYDFPAKTKEERLAMLNLSDIKFRVYRAKVILLKLPTVDLTVQSDSKTDEFKVQEVLTITCTASGGLPQIEPRVIGIDQFDVIDSTFDQILYKRTIKFRASVKNHMSTIKCRAGTVLKEKELKIIHGPSQIALTPEIFDLVENGSTTHCSSVDGYPPPVAQWQFISGPNNASDFYEISSNGVDFLLKKNAPLGSRWKMNCSATNGVSSSASAVRVVTFEVGRRYVKTVDYILVTLVAVIGGAFIGSCIGMTIVCCLQKNRRRGNRQIDKQSRSMSDKELTHSQIQSQWPVDFNKYHKTSHESTNGSQNLSIGYGGNRSYLYDYPGEFKEEEFENNDGSLRSTDNATHVSPEMTHLNKTTISSSSSKDDLHENMYPYKYYL